MNIEEFYDQDPRRRASAELELGREWHDGHGVRYELTWVEDTGELYVMREPAPSGWATPFGGIHVWHAHSTDEDEIHEMQVAVLGVVSPRSEVVSVLSGWEDAMRLPNSIGWLDDRLRQAGVLSARPSPAAATATPPPVPPGAEGPPVTG